MKSKKLAFDLLSDDLAAQTFMQHESSQDTKFAIDLARMVKRARLPNKITPGVGFIISSRMSSLFTSIGDTEKSKLRKHKGVRRLNEIANVVTEETKTRLEEEIQEIVLDNFPIAEYTFTHIFTRGVK